MNPTKKTITIAILLLSIAVCVGYIVILHAEIQNLNEKLELAEDKVEFLEQTLAQKSLEYEWLEELTSFLIMPYEENAN